LNSGLIFEYASQFANANKVDPVNFRLSDKDYQNFVSFLNENKFTYTTSLETTTLEMIEASRKDSYYAALKDELVSLKNKIESNKTSDLYRFKDQISLYLEDQIAFHAGLVPGQTQLSLKRSKEISEAVRVLNDSPTFKKMLHGAHTQP
jgi:carboxyl-terminal processing protease